MRCRPRVRPHSRTANRVLELCFRYGGGFQAMRWVEQQRKDRRAAKGESLITT